MKPYCVKWQGSPLSDNRSYNKNATNTMPRVNRSDSDLTNLSKSGKMLAPNLMRLNSVGEVSAESFPERAARKNKLGFSRSLDSISPVKGFSTGTHRNNTMRSASFLEAVIFPFWNDHPSLSPPGVDSYHHKNNIMPIIWQQPPFQPGVPQWKQNSPLNFNDYHSYKCSPMYNYKATVNNPYQRKIPGLLPGALYTAMSAFPHHAKTMPESPIPSQVLKTHNSSQSLPTFSLRPAEPALKKAPSESVSDVNSGNEKNCIVSFRDDEKHEEHFKKAQSDVVSDVSRHKIKQCVGFHVGLPKTCDSDFSENGKESLAQAENSLKRRNEKVDENLNSARSSTSSNSTLTSVINDLSSVLSLRKAPKKGRPSCKKRKKRQNQTQKTSIPLQTQMNNCENVKVSSPYQPPQCSPIQMPLSASSPSTTPIETSDDSVTSPPSSSHPPPIARLFYSPHSDSDWSDSESADIDDCDSSKLSCDLPKSLSQISDLGSALSFDTLFKPNSLTCLDKLLKTDSKCGSEPDPKSESFSSSGTKKSLCFSFSFSVSEDEDSDKSFESLSGSPAEQFILDFEFGNGLSLEAVFGKKADHFSCSSKSQHTDNEVSQPEHDALLMKINAEWNRNYPSLLDTTSTDKGKVQFANEEDLVQIHTVGNEERRGTWCEDGQRFLKRIQDVGKIISYVFTEEHRQDMRQKLGLT